MVHPVRAAAVCLALAGCVRNPATGKLELNLLSQSQEIELGKQGAAEVEQSIGLYRDPKIEEYVATLGHGLSQQTPRKDLPWQFQVVEDASVNAFALPGGPVFVTRGILGTLMNEAQLAAVVGHECGHIAARHSASQMSKAQLAQLGLGIGSILSPQIASLGQVAGAGLQLLFLKFSRDDESQADQLGFEYMSKQGYDAREMINLFRTLDGVSKLAGGGKLPEWLETHPEPKNREKDTMERLKASAVDWSAAKVRRDEYLGRIDGLPYGEDPRQGYFEGARFLHPQLKFQVSFPPGWQAKNTPQAVIALGPDKDAAAELAPAGKLSPEEAAQKFFSEKGIQQGQAAQVAVGGLPAIVAYFAAQTQQGDVAGIVGFVAYGGMTYALLGYAASQALPKYDAAFKAFIGSFAPLTDPAALGVQPAKIEIVRVPLSMTLEEFNQRHPSNLRIEELALINGLESKESRLESGKQYKRVVGGLTRKAAADRPPGPVSSAR
jgi:predicted Zn-dependent protease